MEAAQGRAAQAQRNHIGGALRAFVPLEAQRLRTAHGWYEAKRHFRRDAVPTHLANPIMSFTSGNFVTSMRKKPAA